MKTIQNIFNPFLCLFVLITFNSQAAVSLELCPEENLTEELRSDSLSTSIQNDFLRPLALLTGPKEIFEYNLEISSSKDLMNNDKNTMRSF